MTYNKPEAVSYTDMAIWIDSNVYEDDIDDQKLYEYLYHLSCMLANQNSYFKCARDYDEFGLFAASRLFARLKNKKQYESTSDGTSKLPKIKSVLNYLKKVIYPYKVDFELEFRLEDNCSTRIDVGSFDLSSTLIESTSLFDLVEFAVSLGQISTIVRSYLQKIPKKKDSSEWLNIYLSCLLTLLDSVTLPVKYIKHSDRLNDHPELLDKIYSDQRLRDPILIHLPESMKSYISVLVNELRHVIASELSWKLSTYLSPQDTTKSLLLYQNERDAE